MKKLVGTITLIVLLLIEGLPLDMATAAGRERPFRIGVLTASWGPTPSVVGLRDGLVELGYREDKDFVLGVRFTQGDITALSTAAHELVQFGVDLIFTSENDPAIAAKKATKRIPIVFTVVSDPVGLGLIQSFAHPGGNVTGVTELSKVLSPKRLELFRQILPSLKRVFYLYHPYSAASVASAQEYREAARLLGIELMEEAVQTKAEAQTVLNQILPGGGDGIVQPPSVTLNIPGIILDSTIKRGIPTMFDAVFYVEHGALTSYGPDFYQSGRLAARLVDKIFKGASPAEIPVEVNSKIELAINLKTAEKLGLTISPELLYQANRLIR